MNSSFEPNRTDFCHPLTEECDPGLARGRGGANGRELDELLGDLELESFLDNRLEGCNRLVGELAEDHPADEDGLELLGELLASTGRGLHDDQERLQVRFLFLLDAEGTWGVLSRRKSR